MTTAAVTISNLNKVYQKRNHAVRDLNLSIDEGQFFALLGPNGAGKSTTIGILAHLINKTSGQVLIFDHDLDLQPFETKRHIGLVPQEFNFNIFETAYDVVYHQSRFYGLSHRIAKQRTEHYLRTLDLWAHHQKRTRFLSGGMKRRLMIARALVHEPPLLVLDEPTAGVDIELRHEMWDFLKKINQQGTTIILTTHYLEEAEALCDEVGIIDHGRLVKRTAMRHLLQELDKQTFLLELSRPIQKLPQHDLLGFQTTDEAHLLEAIVPKGISINQLLSVLSEANIDITSIQLKTNRLEHFFLQMTQGTTAHG